MVYLGHNKQHNTRKSKMNSFDNIQSDSVNFNEREAYEAQREMENNPPEIDLNETDYHFDIAQDNWLP